MSSVYPVFGRFVLEDFNDVVSFSFWNQLSHFHNNQAMITFFSWNWSNISNILWKTCINKTSSILRPIPQYLLAVKKSWTSKQRTFYYQNVMLCWKKPYLLERNILFVITRLTPSITLPRKNMNLPYSIRKYSNQNKPSSV